MNKVIEARSEIQAPIEAVWAVLRDFGSYPEWNPFTVGVETTLAVGSPVVLYVQMTPSRRLKQVERVTAVEAPHTMNWGMEMIAAPLLKARRIQRLTPIGDGSRTEYYTSDTFSGVLAGLVLRLFGKHIAVGFEGVAESLKRRVEEANGGIGA